MGNSERVAVTTTSPKVPADWLCANTGQATKTPTADAHRRTDAHLRIEKAKDFIVKRTIKELSPSSPTVHERHGCAP